MAIQRRYLPPDMVRNLLEDYERTRGEVADRIMGSASTAIAMGKRIPDEAIREYVERAKISGRLVLVYV
jgi:hypothetical protein